MIFFNRVLRMERMHQGSDDGRAEPVTRANKTFFERTLLKNIALIKFLVYTNGK